MITIKKTIRKTPALLATFVFAFTLVLAGCDGTGSGASNNNNGNNGIPPGIPAFTVTFNSAGGSAVPSQSIAEGATAAAPATPTRAWALTAGLWSMPLPTAYSFGGWRRADGTAWDFNTPVTAPITLTAQWTAPSPIELDLYGTNLVSAAVAHVNDLENAGAFTLAIDDDIQSSRNELYSGGADLTIIGLGGRQKIQFTDTDNNQRLFVVGQSGVATSATLRLGNNITLVGRDNNDNDLVWVRNNGRLYMEYGAWITGHSNSATSGNGQGAAVHISNNSTFTMRGGRIFGNTAPNPETNLAGGVFLEDTAVFIMTGGNIDGNYRLGTGNVEVPADVMAFARHGTPFTMSGNASIYRLTLNTSGGDNNSFIRIGPNWTGSISRLDLRRNIAITTVVSDWMNTNRGVLQAAGGHTLNNNDLDNILAVYFLGSAESYRPFISAGGAVNYEIVIEDGVGVLRANP